MSGTLINPDDNFWFFNAHTSIQVFHRVSNNPEVINAVSFATYSTDALIFLKKLGFWLLLMTWSGNSSQPTMFAAKSTAMRVFDGFAPC